MEISSNRKKCKIKLNEQQLDLFSNSDVEEDISTFTLTLSVNGKSENVPANRIVDGRTALFRRERIAPLEESVNFIESSKLEEDDIAILYGSLVDLDREDFLDNSLTLFDQNLSSIKQKATKRGVVLKIKLKNRKTPVLLSSLGEGVNRYIAILCAIWASKDGVLLIDEIENGIHYSNFPKLWKLIYQTSIDANCQIFITSHSKECIKAFNDMQLNNNDNSSTYFEIYRSSKSKNIQVKERSSTQLEYALTHEGNIRGE
jgi:predicted ATPase